MEAPLARPNKVSTIFPMVRRGDSNRERAASSFKCRAAIACGMPLPCEPANIVRAAHADSMNPDGVRTSATQGLKRKIPNSDCARFAAQAKATLITPTATAPLHKTSRIRHRRPESS
jgi:hypothetical protein